MKRNLYSDKVLKAPYFSSTLLVFALSLMSAFSPANAAEDGKRYAGASCVPYSGALTAFTDVATLANNSTTSNLNVVCPIVHDIFPGKIKDVSVTVIDPGEGSVDCRVLSHYRNNATWFGDWSGVKSSSGGDPSVISFNNENVVGTSNSHHYFRCTIPKKLANGDRFHIISYFANESD